jgi:hypothetical protein
MARKHGVTANTYKKFVIDSGAVYKNYGTGGELLLGATRGGNTFSIETEYREMPADGAKGPVKGSRRVTKVVAKIKANFVEISAAVLALSLPGSAVSDFPATVGKTHDSVKRSLALALADYVSNIAIVGEVTGNSTQPVIVILSNVLADGKFEMGFSDNDESVIAVEFTGHFDPSALDTEPWEIRYPTIA